MYTDFLAAEPADHHVHIDTRMMEQHLISLHSLLTYEYSSALQISLSTGIDRVDLSLDELNFCLEWDERSPVWVSTS